MSSLRASTEAVNRLVDGLSQRIAPLLETQHQGVTIYGAGFLGSWACRQFQAQGIPVRQFLDRDPNKHGTTLWGVPIRGASDETLKDVPFVVNAARHAVEQVEAFLAQWSVPSAPYDGIFVCTHAQRLSTIREDYLGDERSRETFDAILTSMMTGSVEPIYGVLENEMYFALPQFKGTFGESYLDAGAFTGDTVERFIWENMGTFEHLYAFEPGERQFKALQARMRRLSEEWAIDPARVSLEQMGISDRESELRCTFTHDFPLRQGLASVEETGASAEGEVFARTISLDSYLDGRRLSFLKADIEGFEMEMLHGARQTILTHRPKMALSAYHFPSHLYEIAEFVRDLDPSYRFALRQHAPVLGDYVLYCY